MVQWPAIEDQRNVLVPLRYYTEISKQLPEKLLLKNVLVKRNRISTRNSQNSAIEKEFDQQNIQAAGGR
jgi:hypothetical protein